MAALVFKKRQWQLIPSTIATGILTWADKDIVYNNGNMWNSSFPSGFRIPEGGDGTYLINAGTFFLYPTASATPHSIELFIIGPNGNVKRSSGLSHEGLASAATNYLAGPLSMGPVKLNHGDTIYFNIWNNHSQSGTFNFTNADYISFEGSIVKIT